MLNLIFIRFYFDGQKYRNNQLLPSHYHLIIQQVFQIHLFSFLTIFDWNINNSWRRLASTKIECKILNFVSKGIELKLVVWTCLVLFILYFDSEVLGRVCVNIVLVSQCLNFFLLLLFSLT